MNNITLNLTLDIVYNINRKFVLDLFVWQKRWKSNQHHRNRFLHKCRQAGADYYFVLEALSDACRTGRNKFFMSNKELLPVFVHYLAQYFPDQHAYLTENAEEIRLVTLSNGAEIRFVHENSPVAALCGDVYVSEWAWSDNPVQLVQLALDLSMHEQWKRTFYSSRGSGDNGEEAYKKFFSQDRIMGAPTFFDIVTLFDDAENRWDKEQLREAWSRKDFEELFLCRFPHPRW
ncbi:terminase large subunit domain-containing protein [Xenorhabdus szentirmaii]|nr:MULTISPECIES: terminase family protein [Xenorhabdus]MBD2806427.1 hypothetical protein [Xenorhabdus sp. ZM]MBD2825668.1 hypothetical protein [Xenorhabdus sp. 5]PHM32048.1 oxidoreductase [Xenorhabdus szentirmaii DSM 16338]